MNQMSPEKIGKLKAHFQQVAGEFLEGCAACLNKHSREDNGRPTCGIFPEDPTTPPIVIPPTGEAADDPYTRNHAARACFTRVFNERTTLHDSIWLVTWAELDRPCDRIKLPEPAAAVAEEPVKAEEVSG